MRTQLNIKSLSDLLGDPGSLTGREAATRFIGVALLVVVGYLHLMDISHKIEEGVWYMAFLFLSLIVTSVVLAVALVRTDSSTVRIVWVGAAALAAGAMFGYFVSRAAPLPGMADHQGDWFNSIGVFAGLFELGLVWLAGFALRDRVRRRAQLGRRRRRRVAATPALSMLGLFAFQPALALAHGGEEMTSEEMAAAEKAAEMGHDPSQHAGMSGMSHDPLLGGTELTLILLVAVGFVAWAGYALRARVAASPTRVTRRARPRTGSVRQPVRSPRSPVPAMSAAQPGLEGSYVTQASEPATEPTAAVPQNGHRPRAVPRSRVSPA